jgi:hypothetical protein
MRLLLEGRDLLLYSRECCAQQTGMHILVMEALLIAIYLLEGKDVYIHIRASSLPEATVVQLGPAQLNSQLPSV